MDDGVSRLLNSDQGRLILSHLTIRRWLYLTSFVIGMVLGFPLGGEVIEWLLESDGYVPDGVQVIILQPMEVILLQLRIAVQVSIGLTFTVVMLDMALVGLRSSSGAVKEAMSMVSASRGFFTFLMVVLLGLLGVAYAHFILVPFLLEYLAEDAIGSGLQSTWQLQKWVGFVTGLYFSSFLSFQMPVVVTFLLRAELVDRSAITENRSIIWFLALFLGALISPPDPISLFLVGGPMLVLLELALLRDRVQA